MKTIKFQDMTEAMYSNLDQIQDELYERNIRIDKPAYIGDQVKIGNDVMIASDVIIVAEMKIEEGDSILSKPTYIYGSKHTVYNYKEDLIQIGALTGTFAYWQTQADKILKEHYNYTPKQIREYKKYIRRIIKSYTDYTALEAMLIVAVMFLTPLGIGLAVLSGAIFLIIKYLIN